MIQYLLLLLTTLNATWALTPPTPSANLAVSASAASATSFMIFLEGALFHPNGIWPYLFKVYNYGILAIMIFMVSFSILYGAAMMSSDGAGFSRKINAWVYIRSLAGMALLIPMGFNQFAAIQYLVLKIVWWSVWLTSYVFSGVILAFSGTTDSLPARLNSAAIQESYTKVASMAACALSYAPDGVFYDSNTSVTPRGLNFSWTATSTAEDPPGYYLFDGLPSCGRIDVARRNTRYEMVMSSLISSLKMMARPTIYAAQQLFDQSIIENAPTDGNWVVPTGTNRPNAQVSSLCSPYGIPSSTCTTPTATTNCWNQSSLDAVYSSYAQVIPVPALPTPTVSSAVTSVLTNIDIATFIQHFNTIETAVLAHNTTTPTAPTYVPPTVTSTSNMTAKSYIDWQNLETAVDLEPHIPRRPGQEERIYNQAAAEDKLRLLFQYRARNEIANQVYKKLFDEISSSTTPMVWYTSPTTSTNTAYVGKSNSIQVSSFGSATIQGTPHIQTVLSKAVGSIGIPTHSENARWVGIDIDVVPKGITRMLREALSAVTGCTASNCTSMGASANGIFGYQQHLGVKSPIKYIEDMGLGIIKAVVGYQKEMMGDKGLLKQDDNVNKAAYAVSSVTMASSVVALAAVNVYPTVSWLRFANLIIYASSAILQEYYNYMSELDQYALYKYEPLGRSLSSLLLIWGGMFGVFLPAVPYMVILFAVIGWIFLIIEAMFATPLIALGLTHPNSHQFLGASDQTLMMLFMLALRPVTIMIASFFAMFLCQNAVYFLNEGIIRFMEVYFDITSATVNVSDFGALLFGVMLVYTYTLFVVMVQSFSIIGLLPDKIGSWIGMGPMGGTNPLQQVMGLRSSFEGGAQQAAQGISSSSKAKRAGHSGDGPSYRKVIDLGKARENAGKYIDIRLSDASGLRTIKNARTDKQIERLATGLTGDTKKAAIKLLKTDLDPREKRDFLRTCRKSGWVGSGDIGKLQHYLDKAGVRDYSFKSDSMKIVERIAKEKGIDTADVTSDEVHQSKMIEAVCNGQVSTALVLAIANISSKL